MPPSLTNVEVILVSYRSRDHIAELLDTWPQELRVVLVDNSCNSDGIYDLAAGKTSVQYVDGGGQGFARAANLGAQTATAEYLVFVNPDSRPTADQLGALVGGLRLDPSAAAHAGLPMGADGRAEVGAGGWEPSIRRLLVYSSGLHRRLPRAGFFTRPSLGEQLQVDWVCGACMAVRRHQFLSLDGFDEAFYVYAEDMSFGRRARQAGFSNVLRTDIPIPHGAGGSGAPSNEMLRLRGASFAWYVTRYHRAVPAVIMRVIFAAGALARSALYALQGDAQSVRHNFALATGTITRRAYVGGAEVARSRFVETANDPLRRLATHSEASD